MKVMMFFFRRHDDVKDTKCETNSEIFSSVIPVLLKIP